MRKKGKRAFSTFENNFKLEELNRFQKWIRVIKLWFAFEVSPVDKEKCIDYFAGMTNRFLCTTLFFHLNGVFIIVFCVMIDQTDIYHWTVGVYFVMMLIWSAPYYYSFLLFWCICMIHVMNVRHLRYKFRQPQVSISQIRKDLSKLHFSLNKSASIFRFFFWNATLVRFIYLKTILLIPFFFFLFIYLFIYLFSP